MFCGDKPFKIEQFMFCETKQCKVKENLEYWVLVPENSWGQVGRSPPGDPERAMLEAVKTLPSYQERHQDTEIFRSTRHHWEREHTELTRHKGGIFCFMWQVWKTNLFKPFGAQMIPEWDQNVGHEATEYSLWTSVFLWHSYFFLCSHYSHVVWEFHSIIVYRVKVT